LTLNRPSSLNALNLPMIRLLRQQLKAWQNDPEVIAVVLRGAGERAFCAGGDIRSLYESFRAQDGLHLTFFEEEYALDHYIYTYSKPILALMDGFVLGGGMGLVQGASLKVITERMKMGMPETGIGYFPDVGGSHFLSRLPGELGTYMGITGNQIRAADALYMGLADWCLPSEKLGELDRCLDSRLKLGSHA
jgi:enoyl-CoA hydratase/carnithine racemase